MASIHSLTLYPIKSCAGIALQEATLSRAGLCVDGVYDREWMVVDPDGMLITQRECPRMALIVPTLRKETLALHAPGMLELEIPLGLPAPGSEAVCTVQVWDDRVQAYDCDEVTATWFSRYLERPCRLVRFHADAVRQSSATWTGGRDAPNLFSDGYPLLVVSTASLAELNARLQQAGRAPLPMNRFRPNLVVDGIEAGEEDYVAAFRFGATAVEPVKPCPRCPMPSVDQATGQFGPDPLDVMQAYRQKPQLDDAICFGMNAIVTGEDGVRVHVGQQIEAELAF